MRTHTIYAAILGEHGNHDQEESYPRPLTCDVCCKRPSRRIDWSKEDLDTVMANMGNPDYWYVTESDPLPDGWQVITSPTYHYKTVYCPSCYADRAEGRGVEIGY